MLIFKNNKELETIYKYVESGPKELDNFITIAQQLESTHIKIYIDKNDGIITVCSEDDNEITNHTYVSDIQEFFGAFYTELNHYANYPNDTTPPSLNGDIYLSNTCDDIISARPGTLVNNFDVFDNTKDFDKFGKNLYMINLVQLNDLYEVCDKNDNYIVYKSINSNDINQSYEIFKYLSNEQIEKLAYFYSNNKNIDAVDFIIKQYNENDSVLYQLLCAAAYKSIDYFKLIYYKIAPNGVDAINQVLHFSLRTYLSEIYKFLIPIVCRNDNNEIESLNTNKYDELLVYTVEFGPINTVKYLVEHGANIHYHNEAPLRRAIFNELSNIEIIKYLIDNGADANVDQGSLIYTACQYVNNDEIRSPNIIRLLIHKINNNYSYYSLIKCIENKNNKLIKLLLDEGVSTIGLDLDQIKYIKNI